MVEIINTISSLPIREKRMTTNGTGLYYLKLAKLKRDALDHISISVDGTSAKENDVTRGKGVFKKVIQTIREYQKAGVKISINYSVTTNNLGSLKKVIPFYAKRGASIINFHRVSLDGNAYNNRDLIVKAVDWVVARDDLINFIQTWKKNYSGLTIRVPYIFLTPRQIVKLNYQPLQEQCYHCPGGGHRLIVFPPTKGGGGLCYMSSDVIGVPNAELGFVTPKGCFVWNNHQNNEIIAYKRSLSSNVSTVIKDQNEELNLKDLIRVSHSFKKVIKT
ncbi:radical SAM protein [Patescibacteria group bacterium]